MAGCGCQVPGRDRRKAKHMREKRITLVHGCVIFIILYIILSVGLYFIAGEEFRYKRVQDSTSCETDVPAGELTKGLILEQVFEAQTDIIDSISIKFATYARQNSGTVCVQIFSDEELLMEKILDVSGFTDNSFVTIQCEEPITNVKGETLRIIVFSETGTPGNSVTLWLSKHQARPDQKLLLNGAGVDGTLCYAIEGRDVLLQGKDYFAAAAVLGILMVLYCLRIIHCEKSGKKCTGLSVILAFQKYGFLLRQLVSRDFKTRYKRSVLGVLWSFLNPLLTMTVQYIVFSTIFKTDIPNFAVYLLIGIVFFNFFSESTNMGLMAIVGNASLITKVYIPKYIFPVSRVLSSSINLLISMVPMLIVVMITSTRITKAILLLPFSIACTIVFCIGMSFILSSAMVYFRDTQFLWSVVSMLWMYATPIFYLETILPQRLMPLFKMNPLYHFIRFSREIIIAGASPEPKAYLFCIIASVVPFLAGVFVFKKTQDKFVLKI